MSGYVFEVDLWEWGGKASRHFLTVPRDVSGIIRMSRARRTGFGSVRVLAQIAGVALKTSPFPDAKSGCYLLPVKAAIRACAGLQSGNMVRVDLSVID